MDTMQEFSSPLTGGPRISGRVWVLIAITVVLIGAAVFFLSGAAAGSAGSCGGG